MEKEILSLKRVADEIFELTFKKQFIFGEIIEKELIHSSHGVIWSFLKNGKPLNTMLYSSINCISKILNVGETFEVK